MNSSSITRDPAVLALASTYYEISTGSFRPSERNEVVVAAALASTPERLRGLAVAVRDPFAWVIFLRCLIEIPVAARTPRSDEAYERLYTIGTELLAALNMSLLRPEDLLLIDTVLEQAAYSLRPNTNLNMTPQCPW